MTKNTASVIFGKLRYGGLILGSSQFVSIESSKNSLLIGKWLAVA